MSLLGDKVKKISSMLKINKKNIIIEVDGGVNPKNVKTLVDAGANLLVAGNSVFRGGISKYSSNINALRLNRED